MIKFCLNGDLDLCEIVKKMFGYVGVDLLVLVKEVVASAVTRIFKKFEDEERVSVDVMMDEGVVFVLGGDICFVIGCLVDLCLFIEDEFEDLVIIMEDFFFAFTRV